MHISFDGCVPKTGCLEHSFANLEGSPLVAGHTLLVSAQIWLDSLPYFLLWIELSIRLTCERLRYLCTPYALVCPNLEVLLYRSPSLFLLFSLFVYLSVAYSSPGYPSHVTLSPGMQPGGGAKISTFSGVLAHITIASDGTPRILDHGEEEIYLTQRSERTCHNTGSCYSLCWFEVAHEHGQSVLHLLKRDVLHQTTADVSCFFLTNVN